MLKRTDLTIGVLISAMWCLAACEAPPRTAAEREQMQNQAQVAVDEFIATDPTLRHRFEESYAYAIFPNVGRGGAIVGGAHGHGVVYEQGRVIGYSELRQADIGAQLGGQAYRQVIFFEDRRALDRFREERLEFAAQASAVAAREGASADANYTDGVLVVTETTGGLMFEATIGGQEFSFEPAVEQRDAQ